MSCTKTIVRVSIVLLSGLTSDPSRWFEREERRGVRVGVVREGRSFQVNPFKQNSALPTWARPHSRAAACATLTTDGGGDQLGEARKPSKMSAKGASLATCPLLISSRGSPLLHIALEHGSSQGCLPASFALPRRPLSNFHYPPAWQAIAASASLSVATTVGLPSENPPGPPSAS